MLQPSDFMPTARIVMRPVDNTAFRVPFVLTEKFDGIAFSNSSDTLSNINNFFTIPAFGESSSLRNITFTIPGKQGVLIPPRARQHRKMPGLS
jgi:hypothetical protein